MVQGTVMLRGIFFQKCHTPFPHVPLRHIDNAPEGKIVPVGDHPQVTEGVLNLHTIVKLDAAVNRIRNFFL